MSGENTYNWQVHGHSDQIALLERAVTGKRLAHAYVFSGPEQIGKRTVAKRLAQILICEAGNACGECAQCKTLNAGSNADYLELSGEDGIKVEAVRELGYKLALKPYAAQYKIAVIDGAHNLTVEASNALLKVLEEPKSFTLMILVTDNAHRLLPTITSRAQRINFGPLSDELFQKWISAQGETEIDASFAGRPGFVINMRNDESARDLHKVQGETFQAFNSESLGSKLVLASELSEKETSDIKSILNYWLSHLERALRHDPSPGQLKRIKAVLRAQRLLDQNVNSKLLLSELMLNAN